MTPAVDSVNPWRATVERFPAPAAAAPRGTSPWQLLMADRAERRVIDGAGGAGDAGRRAIDGAGGAGAAARGGPGPVGGIGGAVGDTPWRARVERFESPTPPAPSIPTIEVVPTFGDTLVADAPPRTAGTDNAAKPAPDASAAPTQKEKEFRLFSEDGITVADVIDIINPLQHIPIVSSLYRHLTGDEINVAPRVIGDTLLFGPIGAAFSVFNVALSAITGKDVGEHVIAFLEKNADPEPTLIVDAGREPIPPRWMKDTGVIRAADKSTPADPGAAGVVAPTKTTADAATPATIPPALAALLPEGATPVGARQVAFAEAAIRPVAFAPTSAVAADALEPTPPMAKPAPVAAASPGAATTGAGAYARLLEQRQQQDAWSVTKAYRRPDPMAGIVAKRTPAYVAGQLAPGATAQDGGWFSDAMLSALAKYQENAKLRSDPPPAGVDVVH